MIVEVYKGVKIRVKKGREWGYCNVAVNGVNQGDSLGTDPQEILEQTKRTVDWAEQTGPAEARCGAEWYPRGTYALCPEGHVTAIGGECNHHWCAAARKSAGVPS